MSTNLTHGVDASVPVSVAYTQWTRFESFPQLMDGAGVEQSHDGPPRTGGGA